MTRIIGIDPGSRITGYGVVEMERGRLRHITDGCIRTPEGGLAERLRAIYDGVCQVIAAHEPTEMAVEKVFVNRNADSALKLGQARGAAIVAGASHGLPVYEFTPAEVKQAIVGQGRADKIQVQHMVKVLLSLRETAQSDAADALAVALCHAHTREGQTRMKVAGAIRWRRR
ncbi:MAG: crossover junction endodeoxyribonuclease RuvC [Chromatiales bacterium]